MFVRVEINNRNTIRILNLLPYRTIIREKLSEHKRKSEHRNVKGMSTFEQTCNCKPTCVCFHTELKCCLLGSIELVSFCTVQHIIPAELCALKRFDVQCGVFITHMHFC